MNKMTIRSNLEQKLNDFDLQTRKDALQALIKMASDGDIVVPEKKNLLNMHCHTFFSFNAYGYSPTSLAWLAKMKGFELIGMVDFDVLDGVDEFLEACKVTRVRGTAGIETRIYIPEFSDVEINSPGEPGVSYHMGIGFSQSTPPFISKNILNSLRDRAINRNKMIVSRVNDYLNTVSLDYKTDVETLSPAATPTERHIVQAYIDKVNHDCAIPYEFWSENLMIPLDMAETLSGDPASLQNMVRSKLIKRDGPGYVTPEPAMFPSVDEFHELIVSCGALPCLAWLDGTSPGEERIDELLEHLINKGVVTVNIIPDRNWNYDDKEIKNKKVAKLYEFVNLARDLSLPINVGTEMNSFGQKVVDDFESDALKPLWKDFLEGAFFVFGHTAMQKYFKMGYQSDWATQNMSTRLEKNRFYKEIGYLFPSTYEIEPIIEKININMEPNEVVLTFNNLVKKG